MQVKTLQQYPQKDTDLKEGAHRRRKRQTPGPQSPNQAQVQDKIKPYHPYRHFYRRDGILKRIKSTYHQLLQKISADTQRVKHKRYRYLVAVLLPELAPFKQHLYQRHANHNQSHRYRQGHETNQPKPLG